MHDLAQIQSILNGVGFSLFPDWELQLKSDSGRPYLQVHNPKGVDAITGMEMPWSGRKWMLSHHMTRSEIVYTAWKALEAAVEHEVREHFTFLNRRVFDPHRNIDLLVMITHDPNAMDVRP